MATESKKRDMTPREVTVKKATKHAGEWHKPGAKLTLTPDQIERKRRHGEIEG